MLLWIMGSMSFFKLVCCCCCCFGYIPKSGPVGSYGSYISGFLRNLHTVFHSGCILMKHLKPNLGIMSFQLWSLQNECLKNDKCFHNHCIHQGSPQKQNLKQRLVCKSSFGKWSQRRKQGLEEWNREGGKANPRMHYKRISPRDTWGLIL